MKQATLKSLDLSVNMRGPLGALAIALVLSAHPALESLNLAYNKVLAKGARHLASALKDHDAASALGSQSFFLIC